MHSRVCLTSDNCFTFFFFFFHFLFPSFLPKASKDGGYGESDFPPEAKDLSKIGCSGKDLPAK
jgi:hypothetical protein